MLEMFNMLVVLAFLWSFADVFRDFFGRYFGSFNDRHFSGEKIAVWEIVLSLQKQEKFHFGIIKCYDQT